MTLTCSCCLLLAFENTLFLQAQHGMTRASRVQAQFVPVPGVTVLFQQARPGCCRTVKQQNKGACCTSSLRAAWLVLEVVVKQQRRSLLVPLCPVCRAHQQLFKRGWCLSVGVTPVRAAGCERARPAKLQQQRLQRLASRRGVAVLLLCCNPGC